MHTQECLRVNAQFRQDLMNKEAEIVAALYKGRSFRQIATYLDTSYSIIRDRIKRAREMAGVRND